MKTHTDDALSMKKVAALVFLPAILLLLVFVASAVLLRSYIPVYLCLLLSIAITIVPFEIAVIAVSNKKKTGTFGLQAAFKNHEPMPFWKIAVFGLVLFGWAGIVFVIIQPIESAMLLNSVFKFVPDFLRSTDFVVQLSTFPKSIIALTCMLNLLLNGIFAPIVEELYFRGYLMSRMEKLGKAAPLVVAVLFSAYHLFTPWENILRIAAFTPLHYVVWKQKNLYIGMLTHCACNLVGAISMFSLLIK